MLFVNNLAFYVWRRIVKVFQVFQCRLEAQERRATAFPPPPHTLFHIKDWFPWTDTRRSLPNAKPSQCRKSGASNVAKDEGLLQESNLAFQAIYLTCKPTLRSKNGPQHGKCQVQTVGERMESNHLRQGDLAPSAARVQSGIFPSDPQV